MEQTLTKVGQKPVDKFHFFSSLRQVVQRGISSDFSAGPLGPSGQFSPGVDSSKFDDMALSDSLSSCVSGLLLNKLLRRGLLSQDGLWESPCLGRRKDNCFL